jgi:benzoyl-CoA reductase/2-hydroxyglutaryl-CoA dehydratase subunit BcrC/BadD/HgdB
MLGEIKRLLAQDQGAIGKWNKPIIGYLCSYVPEELIVAAGARPVRLLFGGDNQWADLGTTCLGESICPFARSIIGYQVSRANPYFNSLDGIIITHTCDAMRRVADVWKAYFSIPVHEFGLPRVMDRDGFTFFHCEVNQLKAVLESWTGQEITAEKLRETIAFYNQMRRGMMVFYDIQRYGKVIRGSRMAKVLEAYWLLDKITLLPLLPNLRETLQEPADNENFSRLLLTGSIIAFGDELLLELIEECGSTVVIDYTCRGFRSFQGLVQEKEDQIEALAERYYWQSPCARARESTKRIAQIQELTEHFAIQGIISHSLKFCDSYGIEAHLLQKWFKGKIPVLLIDRDYSISDIERLRTRLQAFNEVITWNRP